MRRSLVSRMSRRVAAPAFVFGVLRQSKESPETGRRVRNRLSGEPAGFRLADS